MKKKLNLLAGTLFLMCFLTFNLSAQNDLCADAIAIACGATISGSTTLATDSAPGTCITTATAPGVWYSWTGDGTDATFSTCNSATYDTKISVFEGGCGALTCVTGNDDGTGCAGFTSELTFTSTPGTDYLIYVHGFGAATGNFDLTLSCTGPANDICADAIAIECGATISGSTTLATDSAPGTCITTATAPGVWYSWTGDGGDATFSTCNSATYDTKISVFEGGCGALTCVTGNDDGTGCAGFTSELTFTSTPGTDYLIYVHGFGAATGDFDLTLSCTGPVNDICADAIAIACGATISGSTTLATDSAPGTCITTATAPGVWYSWTGDGGDATFSTCNSATYDTKISVFEGGCGALTCVTGNDDGTGCAGFTSELTFTSTPGTDYLIYVHGFGAATGNFDLTLSCTGPANDICADAIAIACGATISGSTTLATDSAPGTCITTATAPGVWYSWTGDGGDATFSTCNSATYDTKISVFEGGCGALTCVTGNDDGTGCAGFTSELTFTSTPGTDYLIYVHGFGAATGDFDLSLTCVVPIPENDLCTGAFPIVEGTPINASTTFATTDDSPQTCGTSAISAGVWYTWTGDGTFATFATCGNSNYDTRIAIFEGACDALSCVVGNDDACGLQSSAGFISTLGTNYFIYVTGFSTSTGGFELNLSTCAGPTAVCTPTAIILMADDAGSATLTTAQVDNGSTVEACSGGGVGLSLSQAGFTCGNIGTPTTVTLTVTDDNGMTATCDVTVNVVDNIAPVINCPNNIVVDNDADLCSAVVAYTATATDNCSGGGNFGPNLLVNGDAETGNLSGWSNIQNGGDGWTVRNNPALAHSGNSCFASSYFWSSKEQVIDLVAAGYTTAELDASPDIYVSEWYAAFFNTTDFYEMEVTLLDENMNTITSIDTGVLTAVPAWQQMEHTFSGYGAGVRFVRFMHRAQDSEFWAGFYGAMLDDAELRVAAATTASLVIDASHVGNTFDVGTTTVTLSTMDDSGNPASCSFSVTVNDIEAAQIVCRQPISTFHTSGTCVKEDLVMLEPFAIFDNCGEENVTFTSDRPVDFEIGTTVVTWIATDANGNESNCQQEVIIHDNEFPVIGPCNSIVQYINSSSCEATVNVVPEITDNCPGVTSTGTGVFNLPAGVYEHEITATDASGNTTVHLMNIYIHEIIAPEFIFCPEEVILVSTDGGNVSYPGAMMATATDNCGIESISNNIPENGFAIGASQVVFTAVDDYGNSADCVVEIIVEESSPITSGPLSAIESSLAENETTQVVTWNPLNATTACEYCEETSLEGFTYVGTWWGHQYFLANEVSLTREDAQLLAEGYDAHLAVINSADENTYLKEALSDEVRTAWIGLMPQEENGTWEFVWDNDEETIFSSLDLDLAEVTENTRIVLSQDGYWVSATDEEDKYFLMERPCVNFEQTGPIYQETEDQSVLLRSGDEWAEGEYQVVYLATDMCGNETEMSFAVDVLPEIAEFCTTSGSDNSIWIEGVVFHDLNNTSDSNDGYADFTEENVTMNIGDGVVLLDLTAGGNETAEVLYWRIWLDRNNDGDFFDADEVLFEASSDLEHLQANVSLELETIESSRLRVAVARHAFPAPCGDPYVGEVEDYNVTLLLPEQNAEINEGRIAVELYPNPATSHVNLDLHELAGEEVTIEIYSNLGKYIAVQQRVMATEAPIQLDLQGLTNGMYNVTIRVEGQEAITKRVIVSNVNGTSSAGK